MWLAEIYDPLLFDFSDKKHYKKSGTEFSRAAHTSGDAMEVDTLTQEKIPKLTPELKEQLRRTMLLLSQGSPHHKDLPQEGCSFCQA